MIKSYKRAGGYLKRAFCHSGDIWMKFRNHRWVANDRSGLDEAIDVLLAQVGPVAEVLGLAEAGVLRRDLATWSDVVNSLSLLLHMISWCIRVHALQRLGSRPGQLSCSDRSMHQYRFVSLSICPLFKAQTMQISTKTTGVLMIN